MELNMDAIQQIMDRMNDSDLSAFRLETDEFKLTIKKQAEKVLAPTAPVQSVPTNGAVAAEPLCEEKPKVEGIVVTSPIVGTFYASAAPGKAPYAKVGQQVKKGDILFVVESMKLMNEITSEYEGTVEEIYAKDGESLEYGQPVLRIV
ncbi:MAG TPA: acetyl-CoA carboxylase biotin carboxyl carrier protein [Ruminococcaceae bacterium]|nr:acetyl-CoA carboxylase biotin carboxyl carrier protein [Oscillospiraceae bacterium]